jgi:hypothetical protein
MPTVPLLADPTNPSGSHRVAAPGGYEGWHFDASSDDEGQGGRVHIVAALYEAWGLDAAYLRRYAWYRTFPTRVAPPNPCDYPAVTFALCEAGRETIRFTARARGSGDDVRVAADGRGVRVGGSHADRSSDDSVRLHLRGTDRLRTIAVDLTFRPSMRPNREVTLLDSPSLGLHRWVVADALCDVEGSVAVFQPDRGGGTPASTVSFTGSGFHDHRYGTRPPATGGEWFGGRVLVEDRVFAFQRAGEQEAHLFAAGHGDADVTRVPVVAGDDGETRIGPIRLNHPTILQADRIETLLTYDAVVGNEKGIALCRKLRLPRWMPRG